MALEISSLASKTMIRVAADSRPQAVGPDAGKVVAQRSERQVPAAEGLNPSASNAAPEPLRNDKAREELQAALSQANELPNIVRRSLEFKLDEDYGRAIITIRDLETDEVLRQIPPEQVVEFSKYLRELAENQNDSITGLVVRLEA